MRAFPILAATALIAGCGFVVVQPAQAAVPPVNITRIWYDSPGVDRRSNASLNAEYVRFTNTTRRSVDLEGWTLRDKTGYRYVIGALVLKPGKTLTVRTGQGSDGTSTVYWNRRQYVWNNDTDVATLRNAAGRLIDSCSYNSTAKDYVTC